MHVMRNVLTKLWTLLLILAMTPGMVELSENVFHWVWQGHAAHEAADGDHHGPEDEEHGCTPSMHLCGCHANLAFTPSAAPTTSQPSRFSSVGPTDARVVSPGAHMPVDRPPRA